MVDRARGPHFAIGSLGGLVPAGTSGIAAAVGHAPDQGLVPDLQALTAMARDVALADITEIGGMTGGGRGAVALFTGIVVHGPRGEDFVAPALSEMRWPTASSRPAERLVW